MPAYVINDMDVTDPALLETYKTLSPATVQQYGGRFVARGGRCEVIEGTWQPHRLVILEFPSVERAKEWADSAEYAPARRLRQRAARSNVVVVDGVPPPATTGAAAPRTYTKRLGILRKRDDISDAAFREHWLGRHAVLCARLPGLRRYSVNFVDRQRFPKFDYDGFSELWFDSEADLTAAFASPEGQALLADLPNFTGRIDPIIATETQVLWP